jgi:hypothetical protein
VSAVIRQGLVVVNVQSIKAAVAFLGLFGVGDNTPARQLRASTAGGRDQDHRRAAVVDLTRRFVIADMARIDGHKTDRLGRIHRAAPTETYDAIKGARPIRGKPRINANIRRVLNHPVKERPRYI